MAVLPQSKKEEYVAALFDFIKTSNFSAVLFLSGIDQNPAKKESSIPFIPGSGITRRILASVPEGWAIPTASILQFVLEGDNCTDAGFLASVIAKVVGTDIAQWRQPGSWQDGLFGTPHDQTLYG